MKAWHYLLFGLLSGLLAAGLILLVSSPARGEPITLPPAPTPAPITVDVSGAVAQPGVYQLNPGCRVQDAIDAAGGLLANAYAETVNLAMPLNDGTKVLIPARPEPASITAGESSVKNSPDVPTLININTASAELLKELPGIGDAKAQAIIDYRESYGPFTAVEQIMNVSGIGQAIFDGLKEQITVY